MNTHFLFFPLIEEIGTNIPLEEVKNNLLNWRDNTRDIISCILFILEKLGDEEINSKISKSAKFQFEKIFRKLQELCTKEIDLLSEGIINIEYVINLNNKEENLNDLFSQMSYIRNNYNKIIDNINKTISSSTLIVKITKDYLQKFPFQKQVNPITNSVIKENEKSPDDLINEIGNGLNDISEISNAESKLSSLQTIKDNKPNSEIPSPREILQNFKQSLKITKYKPSPQYRETLKKFMKDSNSCNIDKPAINENISTLYKGINLTKTLCTNIRIMVHENCYIGNEKKTFEKMKSDNKKINIEINKLKNIIKTVTEEYKILIQKMTLLEEEQLRLQTENTKLTKYIKERYFSHLFQPNNSNLSSSIFNLKQKQILTSLGTQNLSSIDLINNINKNLEPIY